MSELSEDQICAILTKWYNTGKRERQKSDLHPFPAGSKLRRLITEFGFDFENERLRPDIFELNREKIDAWRETFYPEILAKEQEKYTSSRSEGMLMSWEMGIPYYERTEYIKICTGIGDVYLVRYGKHELDVTDYSTW